MFLCRHLLLRVNTTQRTPHRLLFQRFFSEINSPSDVKYDSDTTVHSNQPTEISPSLPNVANDTSFDHAQAKKQESKRSNQPLLLSKLLPFNSEPELTPISRTVGKSAVVEVAKTNTATTSKDIKAYESLRNSGVAMAEALSVKAFIQLARHASKAGLSTVMDHIATDVVENYGGSKSDRSQIACSLVDLAVGRNLLSSKRLHSLLLMLDLDGSLDLLSKSSLPRLVKSISVRLSNDPSADLSIPILLKLLAKHLHASAPKGAAIISYRPPLIVQMLYGLVQNLLRVRRNQQALDIFQLLADSRHIPPEAIRGMNNGSTDPSYIIISTLIKSCLHWDWRRAAVDLCKSLVRADLAPSTQVADLTVDLLYALLQQPTSTDVSECSYLIWELDTRAVAFRLPDGLIRRFYEAAYELRAAKAAEVVYGHTQSPNVLRDYRYPCPQGRCCTWLLRHLTIHSQNMHLARQLTKHVVDSYEPIPPQDRGPFIALTAAHGFGLQAKALWERYAVGKDREAVVGNGATMVRMVSQWMGATRKLQVTIEAAAKDEKSEVDVAARSDFELYKERVKDMTAFANHVVTEFRGIKEPLAKANHFDLTSLARAYFVLGDISAGFQAFRALLDRKEMPDLYDINVALSAMAEYTPRGAAQMIERMISKGVQPDSITFGTVLHFAAVHRDTDLVSTLISRARQLDNGRLTVKSVSGLIRASIETENTSIASLRQNLGRALEIIRSLTESKFTCSPNVGKHCVKASLNVNDPLMAFEFWRLLVWRKVEWTDNEHFNLRYRIGVRIQKHSRAGWLDTHRARVILHTLRTEEKIYGTR